MIDVHAQAHAASVDNNNNVEATSTVVNIYF